MATGRLCTLATWAGCAVSAALAGPASAQVMEFGGGGVTIYDRPAVFSRDGVAAIASSPVRPARKRVPSALTPTLVRDAALQAALSPDLVEAVAWRESQGRHGRVSRRGAVGEMQLMPGTARALRVDAADAGQNYRGGAVYLGLLLKRYDGDLQRALAAYNAGPGAVDRHNGVPPYRETKAYVAAVMDRLSRRAEALDE